MAFDERRDAKRSNNLIHWTQEHRIPLFIKTNLKTTKHKLRAQIITSHNTLLNPILMILLTHKTRSKRPTSFLFENLLSQMIRSSHQSFSLNRISIIFLLRDILFKVETDCAKNVADSYIAVFPRSSYTYRPRKSTFFD